MSDKSRLSDLNRESCPSDRPRFQNPSSPVPCCCTANYPQCGWPCQSLSQGLQRMASCNIHDEPNRPSRSFSVAAVLPPLASGNKDVKWYSLSCDAGFLSLSLCARAENRVWPTLRYFNAFKAPPSTKPLVQGSSFCDSVRCSTCLTPRGDTHASIGPFPALHRIITPELSGQCAPKKSP